MSPLYIIIDGPPISKMRHRCRCINGHGAAYDTQGDERKRIRDIFIKAIEERKALIGDTPFNLLKDRKFSLNVEFFLPIPESDAKGLQKAKEWNLVAHTKKPDVSNMLKFYEDCANEVLYPDDSFITSCHASKRYSKNPRTEIRLYVTEDFSSRYKENFMSILGVDEFDTFRKDLYNLSDYAQYVVGQNGEINILSDLSKSFDVKLKDFASKYHKLFSKLAGHHVVEKKKEEVYGCY